MRLTPTYVRSITNALSGEALRATGRVVLNCVSFLSSQASMGTTATIAYGCFNICDGIYEFGRCLSILRNRTGPEADAGISNNPPSFTDAIYRISLGSMLIITPANRDPRVDLLIHLINYRSYIDNLPNIKDHLSNLLTIRTLDNAKEPKTTKAAKSTFSTCCYTVSTAVKVVRVSSSL